LATASTAAKEAQDGNEENEEGNNDGGDYDVSYPFVVAATESDRVSPWK
jgi:hypothetical protein